MPITLSALQDAALRATKSVSLSEARTAGSKTAFLCHSHNDAGLVRGFVNMLNDSGWKVYVDWADTAMPDSPNRETAGKIQKMIRDLDWFLFLATPSSVASRWCPWEIGYANGVKPIDSLIVVPTVDHVGRHYGNEYLQIYRHIDVTSLRGLAGLPKLGIWSPGAAGGMLLEQMR